VQIRDDLGVPALVFNSERIVGYSRPFSTDELHELYPNREAYLDQWQAALDRGVADGFILREDAHAMKATADETATAIFPK
jgi:Alpha/beta hydrolase domain